MKTCCAVLAVLAVLAAVAAPAAAQEPVSSECIGCICEAASACDITLGCQRDVCGPFRITQGFFIDARQSNEADFAQYRYENCTINPFCSAMVIRRYMARYCNSCDCNGDGAQRTCTDFAIMHQTGPSCTNNQIVLQSRYWQRFQDCLSFYPNA